MQDLEKQYHKCCGQKRIKEVFYQTSTRHWKERKFKIYFCMVCNSKKLVIIYTDRTDAAFKTTIYKTAEANKQIDILMKEAITAYKKHKQFKPDTAKGYVYVNGKDYIFEETKVIKGQEIIKSLTVITPVRKLSNDHIRESYKSIVNFDTIPIDQRVEKEAS